MHWRYCSFALRYWNHISSPLVLNIMMLKSVKVGDAVIMRYIWFTIPYQCSELPAAPLCSWFLRTLCCVGFGVLWGDISPEASSSGPYTLMLLMARKMAAVIFSLMASCLRQRDGFCQHEYYSDGVGPLWHLRWVATWVFVQWLVRPTTKKTLWCVSLYNHLIDVLIITVQSLHINIC